jgi:hypothetical protein
MSKRACPVIILLSVVIVCYTVTVMSVIILLLTNLHEPCHVRACEVVVEAVAKDEETGGPSTEERPPPPPAVRGNIE